MTRSRRSHFSHADTTDAPKDSASKNVTNVHISYENDRLLHFSKSPHSWELPRDWSKICELYPNIIRNKVRDVSDESNNNNNSVHAINNNNNNKSATKTNQNANATANNNLFRRRGVAMSQ